MINAPVNVTGNAVSGIGDSTAIGGSQDGTTGTGGNTWIAPITSGEDGILSGNQIIPVINAPVTIGGNAVSVIGDSTVVTPATPGHPRNPGNPRHPRNPRNPRHPGHPRHPRNPRHPRHPGHPRNTRHPRNHG